MSKVKQLLPFTGIFIILILGAACLHEDKPIDIPKSVHSKDSFIIGKKSIPNQDSVVLELVTLDVQYIDIVICQAILETGNFTSNIFLTRNNLFGFKTKKGYITFKDWKECCKYYKNWQDKHYKGGDYYKFLIDVGYAKDTNYVNKLKKIRWHSK